MNYGEYFGLDARNAYVATASLGNLGGREPMNAVYRTAGMARPIGGNTPEVLVLTTTGTMAGEVSLSPLPAPYTGSETGTYAQERGGTAYEFTNHLGNVLAVVSDKKLGQGGTTATPIATFYHPETRMLADYYPFGMAMLARTWQSSEYRFGFQGQEGDNEVFGDENAYAYTYRMSDARLGRFWSVDPLAGKYPWNSVYAFNENRVIDGVELEGLEWKYTTNPNGTAHISLNVSVSFDENLLNQFSYEDLQKYGNSIAEQFNRTFWLSSKGKISGSISCQPLQNTSMQQFIPSINLFACYSDNGTVSPPSTTWGNVSAPLLHGDGTIKTPDEFANDVIHELFHTLRVAHPFDLTQSDDTELEFLGANNYKSTESTDPNIKRNIMLYNFLNLNGEKVSEKEEIPQNLQLLTKGQIEFIINEIKLQEAGAGIPGRPGTMDYWGNPPGETLKRK